MWNIQTVQQPEKQRQKKSWEIFPNFKPWKIKFTVDTKKPLGSWQYGKIVFLDNFIICVMGCPKSNSTGLEGLFNFHVQNAEMLW